MPEAARAIEVLGTVPKVSDLKWNTQAMDRALNQDGVGLWDTQLVSYAIKGQLPNIPVPILISSVTAQELFRMQRPDSGVRYGLPPRMILRPSAAVRMRRAIPGGMRALAADVRNPLVIPRARYQRLLRSDSMSVSLPGGVRVVENLHRGVAQVVNEHQREVLAVWLQGEEKQRSRATRSRFEWLVASGVECLPLTPSACTVAQNLYRAFVRSHEPKRQIRNTLNDILILAHALTAERPLYTADRVLSEFARDYVSAIIQPAGDDLVRIAANPGAKKMGGRRRDRRGSRSTQHHRMRR